MNKIILSLVLCQLFLISLTGQKINEFAAKSYLRSVNSEKYMSPLIDVFSGSMHASSLSYVHPDSLNSFHISIGVVATAAFVSNSMKSFEGVTEEPFSPAEHFTAPTIFGTNNSAIKYDANGNGYSIPAGFDITQINLAFPVIHVGTIFHTNFSGRFFAFDIGGDLKRIEIYGLGFNHFISDYWNAKNYFVSVGASYDQFSLGSYMKGKQYLAQLAGGQQIGKFNYWAFVQWQKSPYEFYYEDEAEGSGTVKIDGQNQLRAGAGCGIKFWKFYLTAEASVSNPIIAAVGLGLQL